MALSAMFENPPTRTIDELKATLRLAAPLVGANLLQVAVFAIDVVFVARLGPQALAASALSVALFGLLMWSITGLVGAASPLIAAELGKRSHAVREVRRTVRMAGWAGMFAALLSMGFFLLGEPLMRLTGQQEGVIVLAVPFMHVLMWASVPMVLGALLRTVVATLGRPGVATWITGLAVVVNGLGNWVFVFGHLGMPALGLTGSALSSVVTACIMLGAYVVVIRSDRRLRRYRLFGRWWRPEWKRFVEVLRIGMPICATIIAEAGLFNGAAFLMGRIGEVELAAHTVVLQLASIAFMVPFGVAQAATIRVGLAYGAGDNAAIARAGWVALGLGIGFMTITALVMLLTPRFVMMLYIDPDAPANAGLVKLALQYIVVAAGFQLFDGAQAVGQGVLRGLQDTRVPMAIAMFGYWIPGLGTAVLLGLFTPLGGVGVWLGLLVSLIVVAGLILWRWLARGRLGLLPA
ncbi:MATE family efflux transporter [Novosphingobium cyanobacteriorum]|uniref:Multidrug-efflux transporter n=1 Tax=Novosphingobium cyanobacteriorum TaxID=3024215 RepID=A0ABT6CG50_9SPHN|nr:MATE family efflux transporter [Novosphingobium cyanobacteriorum]MDF8332901.1 MATE family efflux transporter [Novosphingobium cyanobacteriorum]